MPRRPFSSCRQFRRQHTDFMDGFLSEGTSCDMQEHLICCPSCARHDVWMRRSLLALQALPRIEPSADFRERLYERLAIPTEPPRLVSISGR
jgi:hypothetical protein